jgi:hypothetical protein
VFRAVVFVLVAGRFPGVPPAHWRVTRAFSPDRIIAEVGVWLAADDARLITLPGCPAASGQAVPFTPATAEVKVHDSPATVRAVHRPIRALIAASSTDNRCLSI